MKKFLKAPVILMLALLARGVVRKYRPQIVMVTGSVGKTSTKNAIAAVLSRSFFVRASAKSYNSESGVPLTIFGMSSPWMSPLKWILVFKEALALLLLPNHYPTMLVLEVGADRPGDLARILRIAIPSAVVVTELPEVPVHVEAYPSPEALRDEEFLPAFHLPPSAPLIISTEDDYAERLSARVAARVTTYGLESDADLRITNINFYTEGGKILGMQAYVETEGAKEKIVVKGSVGKTQILPAAAALALAGALGIAFPEAIKALASYEPPPGRGRLLSGKNGSIIIDDSYNSSPVALVEALSTLESFPNAGRRVAVLGDMLELGRYSVMEHERIGTEAAECTDVIATVGVRARRFAEAARAAGTPAANVFSYDDSRAAASALIHFVQAGDVVLIKGSQSIRTERIAQALLANPADSSRLVRQEPEWKQKV